jgi:hypothetical protein
MTKIQPVRKIAGYNMSLAEQVNLYRNHPRETVKMRFGEVGTDIYDGKKPTILSQEEIKESKKLINRIKNWWNGMGKFDYEEGDRLSDVILKYALNKQSGTVKDIEKLFGKEGVSELKVMSRMGYIEI